MSSLNKALLAAGATLFAASVGHAAPYAPPGETPIYIKFGNAEQICIEGNCITAPATQNGTVAAPAGTAGGAEQNWGIINVTSILGGDNQPPNDPYLYPDNGIPLWSTNNAGNNFAQITGIFYGIQATACTTSGVICSTGGYMDLWYDEDVASAINVGGTGTFANLSAATPGQRTGVNDFTNFTDGTFLGRLAFAPGISSDGDPDINIIGSATPSFNGFTGFADSYADVVDVNGDGEIDSDDGLWAAILNGDYFPVLVDGDPQFRDFRFKNSYNLRANWNDLEAGAVGAVSDDPARVVTVPEPGTIALFGLTLLGLGYFRRKRA